MKGMVFTGFAELVVQTWDEDLLDDIFDDTGLDGAYTAVGTYPHTELVALVEALSARTEVPVGELLRLYGHHLMGMLHAGHGQFFARVQTLPDFLDSIEHHVHTEVRKLYPEADPPELKVDAAQDSVRLVYRSHRPFADLALGLLQASLPHFPGEWSIERAAGEQGTTVFLIQRHG